MSNFNSTMNRAVWFDIPVADIDRAAAFYQAVLGVEVHIQEQDGLRFGVLDHQDGNGGCLVPAQGGFVSEGGILLYLNVDGRIRDAVAQVTEKSGKVLQALHGIGPYGWCAIVIDSEGNRIALHSNTNA